MQFFLHVDGPITGGGRYLISWGGGGGGLLSSHLWYVVCV